MKPLDSQIAVVTGAARGVGEAVARKLAGMGAQVVLVARDQQRLDEVRRGIEADGGKAVVLVCDLVDADAVAALGAKVAREFRRCDILINNAGVGQDSKPLHELEPAEWDRVMSTNLRGPYI